MYCFDSRSTVYKSPFGALPTGETVTFRLLLPILWGVQLPCLLLFAAADTEKPMITIPMEPLRQEPDEAWFTTSFSPENPSLFFYRFSVHMGEETVSIGHSGDALGRLHQQGLWQLTVYDKEFQTPAFLKGGLVYQIFPDRFYKGTGEMKDIPADRILREDWRALPNWRPDENGNVKNNDYFSGNLRGITEKLAYLRSLSVTAIYLNPIFEAHSNHRYNTADYQKIDPLLGNEIDFSHLCKRAGELGISVILDGVFSHTGSDSLYFNREGRYGVGGAYKDPKSPYFPWYQFGGYPDDYRSWWGFKTLPEIDEENKDYQRFICGDDGVIAHWMRAGAAGFRLDVADELPDSMLDQIRHAVKLASPEGIVIGEVWEDASNKISYGQRRRYLLGEQLDSVMNYPLADAIIRYIRHGDHLILFHTLMDILENYPPQVIHTLINHLSTHDTTRAITALAGEDGEGHDRQWQEEHHFLSSEQYQKGRALFQLASVLQYTLPGTPSLYYGDEVGLSGYRDPFNRVCYPWGGEDGLLLRHFEALGEMRAACPALRDGDFFLTELDSGLCSFTRIGNGQRLFIAINRGAEERTPILPPGMTPDTLQVIMGTGSIKPLPVGGFLVTEF